MRKFLLLSAFLATVIGFSSEEESESSIRAIFLSTSNNVIEVNTSKTYKRPKAYTFTKAEIPAGIELKVYKVQKDGRIKQINLRKNILKTGDEFYIEFRTNVPGFVEVINITPKGEIKLLGVWKIPAFTPVRLPPKGNFKLVNKKGKEKLVFILYPCQPVVSKNSRDIEVVYTSNQIQLSQYVKQKLPICSYTSNGVIYTLNNERKVVSARDIIISSSQSKLQTQYVSYEQGANYYIDMINPEDIKPIVATIEIIHR